MNIIKKFSLYWNEPQHPLTEKDIADLKAMQQLMAQLQAIERKTGKTIICQQPDSGCGF